MGKSQYAQDISELKVSVGKIQTSLEVLPDIETHLRGINNKITDHEIKIALANQIQDMCPWTETTPAELKAEIKEEAARGNPNGLPIDLTRRSHRTAVGGGVLAAVIVVLGNLMVLWRAVEPYIAEILFW